MGSDLEFILKKCPPLDFSVAQQLPDLRHVLSRLWNILEDFPPNTDARLARAKRQLAEELWYDWIYINIPPVHVNNIVRKLDNLYKEVDKLNRTSQDKRGPTWRKQMEKLNSDLSNGFDLRSSHSASLELLTDEFGIAVGEEEELLYKDNCIPINGKCPRVRFCAGVDSDWVKEATTRQELLEKRDEFAGRKALRIQQAKDALAQL